MKKVLLKFYDKNNLGDDLFIKIITERYKNKFSLILLKTNQYLENIAHLKVYKNKVIYLFFKLLEKTLNIRNIWLRLLTQKHDLLINVGGSIFIETPNLRNWENEKHFYQNLNIPYYILGSNFGPYRTSKFVDLISQIVIKAKDVCFRDNASYEIFKELTTTRRATDIVFSLDTSNYKINNEKVAIFSIIKCDNRFGKPTADKYEREIINMTHHLVKKGYRVVYMSFCQFEGDELAIQRIRDCLDKELMHKVDVFNYNGNLEAALRLIAKSEIVIATRFHAVILALLFAKKVLPIAYDKKTINILKDIDFKGRVIDINSLDDFDGSHFDFNQLEIHPIEKQRQLAELQFQELDKILIKKSQFDDCMVEAN